MSVAEAVAARRSCRAFLSDAIDADFVRDVLVKASRAASGGNVQPWRIYLLHGERMDTFKAGIAERVAKGLVDTPEYPVYPSPLKEPYRTQRFAVGEEMYARLGIPREDKMARLEWFANNYQFFGAPVALFFTIDRDMEQGSWVDYGMFLQSLMLAAREQGLETCAQAAFCPYYDSVMPILGAPSEQMLVCGMSIGYADPDAVINEYRTSRLSVDVFRTRLS